jgi:hypothetical protein
MPWLVAARLAPPNAALMSTATRAGTRIEEAHSRRCARSCRNRRARRRPGRRRYRITKHGTRSARLVPARERRAARHQHRVRQRALLPGQRERAVGPRTDAAPAELPRVERHRVLELAHSDDRPHGRRQPFDLHRPLRRPARAAGDQQLLPLQPGRHDRPGDLLRLLDESGRRHREGAERRARHGSDDELLAVRTPRPASRRTTAR